MKRDCILKFKVYNLKRVKNVSSLLLEPFPDGVKINVSFDGYKSVSHDVTSDELVISAPDQSFILKIHFGTSLFNQKKKFSLYSPYNSTKNYQIETPITIKDKKGTRVELTGLTFIHSGFKSPKIGDGHDRSRLFYKCFDELQEVTHFSKFLLDHNKETGENIKIKNIATDLRVARNADTRPWTKSFYIVYYYNKS